MIHSKRLQLKLKIHAKLKILRLQSINFFESVLDKRYKLAKHVYSMTD